MVMKPIQFANWTIDQFYETNGANVPRFLWWLFEPNNSDMMPAIICHDFLCDIADGSILYTGDYTNFYWADRILKFQLEKLGVAKWKRNLIYASVRVYHKIKYERKWLNKRYKQIYSIY